MSLIDHARTAATAWKDEADRTGDPHLDHEDAFIAGAQWFAGLADTPPATIDAVTATIERLLNSQRAYGYRLDRRLAEHIARDLDFHGLLISAQPHTGKQLTAPVDVAPQARAG